MTKASALSGRKGIMFLALACRERYSETIIIITVVTFRCFIGCISSLLPSFRGLFLCARDNIIIVTIIILLLFNIFVINVL